MQQRRRMVANIGHRCHWRGESMAGTITSVTTRGAGWPAYVIEWDADCPDWWSSVIAPSTELVVS